MDTSILKEIGLTDGEIAVYISTLEIGSSTVKPIVDKAKVSYSKIYDILERLIDKGLVSYVIKDNKKYFEAAPAERVMDYILEKEKQINVQKEKLKNLLPQLKLKQQMSGFSSKSTIYKGIKGLNTAYSLSLKDLKSNDEILMIYSPSKLESVSIFFKRFLNEVKKRNIKSKVLSNEEDINISFPNIKYTRHIIPATIAIFGNKTIIFPTSKDIVLFVIDNKEVAESFKVQFYSWWDQKVKTYEGIKQIRKLWMEKLKFGEYCGFGEGTKIVKVLGEKFFVKWQKEKKKRSIRGKVLIGEKFRNSVTVKKSIAEFKFISGYENPGVTEVFNDKVIVVNFSGKPVAFVIDDRKVAQNHQTYFDLLWKTATP